MKLKAEVKYKKGDKIWMMKDNVVTEVRIVETWLFFKLDKILRYYSVQLGGQPLGMIGEKVIDYVREEQVFPSSEELIKFITKNLNKITFNKGLRAPIEYKKP